MYVFLSSNSYMPHSAADNQSAVSSIKLILKLLHFGCPGQLTLCEFRLLTCSEWVSSLLMSIIYHLQSLDSMLGGDYCELLMRPSGHNSLHDPLILKRKKVL
ncbi:hypothetical protein ElyMa_005166300 [Elysia marginata]|uniref:Uncharacterized protein n=1 Tax=Elysia marginata TaxID=1093978 RepID=A0AAV4JQZ6_9GAST|nr:hypothetical protein ElyMa_005166300 [Elysia marginata]